MKQFTPDQKLLALTWKQPFAELMLHGKIETRIWKTAIRGWVLICAGKKPYTYEELYSITDTIQYGRIENVLLDNLSPPTGVAVAIGYLEDCRPMTKADENKCFVAYHPDLWCHVYKFVVPVKPFPWLGSQGWREVPDEIKNDILIIPNTRISDTLDFKVADNDSAKIYALTFNDVNPFTKADVEALHPDDAVRWCTMLEEFEIQRPKRAQRELLTMIKDAHGIA